MTIIDGGKAGTVVTFQDGKGTDAVLQGFKITQGLPRRFSPFGGGVYVRNANLIISLAAGGIPCHDAGGGNILSCRGIIYLVSELF